MVVIRRAFHRLPAILFSLWYATPLWLMLPLSAGPASGQVLRPDHWPESYIQFLQVRGQLRALSPFLRPVQIDSLQAQLARTTEPAGGEHARFLGKALQRWQLQPGEASVALVSENTLADAPFVSDFRSSARSDYYRSTPVAGIHYPQTSPWLYHSRQRLELAFRPLPWLTAFNSAALDNRSDETGRYMGITQSGYAGWTDRAFLGLQHKGLALLVGREYLRVGPGIDAALLISTHSRPMDQIAITWENRWLRYDFIFASLDQTAYPEQEAPARQQRRISLHHLQIRPHRALYLGVGEAILYHSAGVELNYLNPVLSYHGEQMNGPVGGNTLGSLHIAVLPASNFMLYADLLIDDIQLEKSGPGDLEPSEYGVLAGVRWADPFGLKGGDIATEYTRITNRTFNGQGGPWEKWLHRGEPIAHFLGNDFDRWLTHLSWWPRPAWRLAATMDLRRRGQGRIENPFDAPWMETPVGQEYHEPFPSGVVEKSGRCELELSWQPNLCGLVYARFGYATVRNFKNQSGLTHDAWQGSVGAEFDLFTRFKLQ